MTTENELNSTVDDFIAHLREITSAFNEYAGIKGLPVVMNPLKAIENLKSGINLHRVFAFWSNSEGGMRVAFVKTALDCFYELCTKKIICGHIIGSPEEVRMATSLALQWAGPIFYQLTGKRIIPLYLIDDRKSSLDQLKREENRFLNFYGDIELELTDAPVSDRGALDPVFEICPTLTNYRVHALQLKDGLIGVPKLERIADNGKATSVASRKLYALGEGSVKAGLIPLIIVNEPKVNDLERGAGFWLHSPIVHIFTWVKRELYPNFPVGDGPPFWIIGLSPHFLQPVDGLFVWEVQQHSVIGEKATRW